jgi:hypothetical protein
VFFNDIDSGHSDYKLINQTLLRHHAQTVMFLTKGVTHIIQNNQRSRKSPRMHQKCSNTRAARMVQASIKQSAKPGLEGGCSDHSKSIISPLCIERMSGECGECALKGSRVGKSNYINSEKREPYVRSLSDLYFKIEDMEGRFRPLYREMKEWPEIFFHSIKGASPFDNPNMEHTLRDNYKITKKTFLCELCMICYTDMPQHIKSLRHKHYAENNERFTNLDRTIANGPSISDLMPET